jgi:recombinational DNA repair protein (RecF pathway)
MDLSVAPKALGKNPFTIICYLCGREYGSKSISIHEEQCKEKWIKTNNALPKHLRKKIPERPRVEPTLPGQKVNEQYNQEAFEQYQEAARHPCQVCGRKFVIESLEKHQRVCKPGGYFEKHT